MKKTLRPLLLYIILCQNAFAQNIGIGTTLPLSRLDINGDIALRSADITISTTYNYALDVTTIKRSNYKLKSPPVPVGNFIVAGIASGVEGRILTLTNRTGSSMEIYNEDVTAIAANRIQTGTGGTVAIYPGGAVTLLYDASDQRWSIKSMHYNSLDYFGGGGSDWSLTGNAGTTAANFLGTTDNQPLIFKVNGNIAGMISPLNLNTAFGNLSLSANTTGNANTANGHNALRFNSTGSYNTAMGTSALRVNGASENTAVGYRTLSLNESGQRNTALGTSSLTSNISGSGNTAIGFESMAQGEALQDNTAVGFQTLYSLSSGNGSEYNNAFGYRALASLTNGNGNTAVGSNSMEGSVNAFQNTAVGGNTLMYAGSPSNFNTAIGFGALERSTTGIQNTAVGAGALNFITTGSFNTAIGQGAGTLIGGLSNFTVIGTHARVSLSNMMMFGNEGVVKWGFGNATPAAGYCLEVGVNSTNGNDAKLTNGGVWTNASDKNLKEDFQKLDGYNILAKVNDLEITRWRYKGLQEYHIGPMAQDFQKLFNTGNDDKSISTIDPAGVALLAIQALIKENKALKSEMQNLQLQIDDLKKLVKVIAAKN